MGFAGKAFKLREVFGAKRVSRGTSFSLLDEGVSLST